MKKVKHPPVLQTYALKALVKVEVECHVQVFLAFHEMEISNELHALTISHGNESSEFMRLAPGPVWT